MVMGGFMCPDRLRFPPDEQGYTAEQVIQRSIEAYMNGGRHGDDSARQPLAEFIAAELRLHGFLGRSAADEDAQHVGRRGGLEPVAGGRGVRPVRQPASARRMASGRLTVPSRRRTDAARLIFAGRHGAVGERSDEWLIHPRARPRKPC